MQQALQYALYVWLCVSAAALLIQLVRRARYRGAASELESTTSETPSDLHKVHAESADVPDDAPMQPASLAHSSGVDQADHIDVTDNPSDSEESPATETDQSEMPRSANLADLLNGIRLPHRLEPIVPDGIARNDEHLCLLTSQGSPEEVGIAISEELERLGYEVMGISETEAVAQRGGDVLSLLIETDPTATTDGQSRRYPQATTGDVVLEIWVGAAPLAGRSNGAV